MTEVSVGDMEDRKNGRATTYRAAGHAASNSGPPHIVPGSRILLSRGQGLVVGGTHGGILPAGAGRGRDDGADLMAHLLHLVARDIGHGGGMLDESSRRRHSGA